MKPKMFCLTVKFSIIVFRLTEFDCFSIIFLVLTGRKNLFWKNNMIFMSIDLIFCLYHSTYQISLLGSYAIKSVQKKLLLKICLKPNYKHFIFFLDRQRCKNLISWFSIYFYFNIASWRFIKIYSSKPSFHLY